MASVPLLRSFLVEIDQAQHGRVQIAIRGQVLTADPNTMPWLARRDGPNKNPAVLELDLALEPGLPIAEIGPQFRDVQYVENASLDRYNEVSIFGPDGVLVSFPAIGRATPQSNAQSRPVGEVTAVI